VVDQANALIGIDEILPVVDPMVDPPSENDIIYDIIDHTEAFRRFGYLLSSPSDEILCLAFKVYEKIPWTSHFQSIGPPDVDVVKALLRRLMSPECRVFTTALRALDIFLNNHVPMNHGGCVQESGILKSGALKKIVDLASSSDVRVQQTVATIFGNFGWYCRSAEDVQTCIDAGVVQALRTLLASMDQDVRMQAVEAIREFPDRRFSKACLSANILPVLIALPAHPSVYINMGIGSALLRITQEVDEFTPLEAFAHPGLAALIVKQLVLLTRVLAEAAFGSLVRRYKHDPDALVTTTFIEPITDLLSSSHNNTRASAARAIWLASRHSNRLTKAFLAVGVMQRLAILLSSSNELVLKSASSAIWSLSRTEGDDDASMEESWIGVWHETSASHLE
jgi:hypothetical protein